jgi:hypothetical protein
MIDEEMGDNNAWLNSEGRRSKMKEQTTGARSQSGARSANTIGVGTRTFASVVHETVIAGALTDTNANALMVGVGCFENMIRIV